MRKFTTSSIILAFAIIGLITIAITEGCRKVDREGNAGSSGIAESRFFNQHTSSEPLVQAIAGFMKRKNVKTNFVTTTISRIGYPRWDKSRTVSWQKRAGFVNSDDDTTDITYIPFVRDSQNYVNAAWIIKTTPTDTAFGYLCDWQYKDYGFDSTQSSWNARNVFHLFTRMDKDVFDRNQFRIIDEELLTQPEKDYLNSENLDFDSAVVVYSIESSQSGSFNNLLMPVTICDDIFTCIRVRTLDDPLPARQSLNQVVPGCPSGTIPISSTICTEVWVYIPSSGGGSDDGPGGDPGSGGGGGSTPPDCPNGTGRNNLTDDPCGPGWIPIEDLPSIEEPIDSIKLKEMYLLIKDTVNYYHAKADVDSAEWSLTLTKNNELFTRNPTKGFPNSVTPNLHVPGGDTIIGAWHAHFGNVHWLNKNICFSSKDYWYVYQKLRFNDAVVYITTKDYIYAMVITDAQLFKNYVDGNNTRIGESFLDNLYTQGELNCSACSASRQSETANILIAGNSMFTGIKVYKSDRNSILFISLN